MHYLHYNDQFPWEWGLDRQKKEGKKRNVMFLMLVFIYICMYIPLKGCKDAESNGTSGHFFPPVQQQ